MHTHAPHLTTAHSVQDIANYQVGGLPRKLFAAASAAHHPTRTAVSHTETIQQSHHFQHRGNRASSFTMAWFTAVEVGA